MLGSKYIYGPGIDQPVCMIEVADSSATYYYHFDALGSVVALSDSAGNTVQTYQYSVYGEVAVEDANHTNPYMFTGRRFDVEIGLYYFRARYYNPFMGRFLQTDPIGYEDGMNMYRYCANNPLAFVDPSGYLTIHGPVTADKLMHWYMMGGGETLEYGPTGWDSLVGNSSHVSQQIENAMAAKVKEWFKQSDSNIPGAPHSGSFFFRIGVEFETLGRGGSLVEHLVHNATVLATGHWKRNGERIRVSVEYELHDNMDLHPERGYPMDIVAFLVSELGWNLIGHMNPIAMAVDLPRAQPYLLIVRSGSMTEHWTRAAGGQVYRYRVDR